MASVVALRGLSLRPVIHTAPPIFQPRIDIRPTVYLPPQATPGHDDLDDEPDNVHPFQR